MRAKINIAVFLLALVAALFVGVLLPADEESVLEENRTPAEFPHLTWQTLFDGEFSRNFENYLADHVGFRSFFTARSAEFAAAKGINLQSGTIVEGTKDLGTGDTGEKKQLLVQEDRIAEVFVRDAKTADQYVEMLNHYAEILPPDINLYAMLIPTQIEFIQDTPGVSDSQKTAIRYVYDNVNPRIRTVDAYAGLAAHQDEYIYFRTDHHWTQLGAFYAYNAFLETKGESQASLDDYEKRACSGFYGTLYKQAGMPEIKPDIVEYFVKGENLSTKPHGYNEDGSRVYYDGSLYWIPATGEDAAYKMFLCGDHAFLDIPTNTQNGKTILLIKDSYANAFAPWLVENYEHVLLVDPRSFRESLQTILDEYAPDDVMIVNYALSTTFSDFIQAIQNLAE